jgi:transcriptional regulator with XRE-family HTH domain
MSVKNHIQLHSSYAEQRVALGAEIRGLRKFASLTGTQLSEKTGISQSKISKIENGSLVPSREDITQLCDALGVSKRQRVALLDQLALIQTEFSSWRVLLRNGYARKQVEVADLESQASEIRLFQMSVVPGLLQTRDYAQRVMALSNVTSQVDVAAAVATRMRRQAILQDESRSFIFLITEQALLSRFCSEKMVLSQLEHLTKISLRPNVIVGLIPDSARLEMIPLTSFGIYDNDLVLVETLTAEISVSDQRDIEKYREYFQSLGAAALYGANARPFLERCRRLLHEMSVEKDRKPKRVLSGTVGTDYR